MITPRQAAAFFVAADAIATIRPLAAGNVNHTWLLRLADGSRRVLQRLNPDVFPEPGLIMDNLQVVTRHLRRRLARQRSDDLQVLRILRADNGADRFLDAGGGLWRMLEFIDAGPTLKAIRSRSQARAVGRTLGRFHLLLRDLDPSLLGQPLPGFHVTPAYLDTYDRAGGPAAATTDWERFCAARIREYRSLAAILEENRSALCRQVIHGDPKVANFLFDAGCRQVISLIDLDTVAPGLLLHDLGDCLRSCCNRQGEEPGDPAGTRFDADIFSAFLEGYAPVAGCLPGRMDRELLVPAVQVITFELGLRFFTDHLAGDRYFSVDRPGRNLHRALVQFQLLASIRDQENDLHRRTREILQ